MKLSQFPKALGIKNLTKGYHPYHFTDLSYVEPMILMDYFDLPENTKELEMFEKWYAEQCKKPYVFCDAI